MTTLTDQSYAIITADLAAAIREHIRRRIVEVPDTTDRCFAQYTAVVKSLNVHLPKSGCVVVSVANTRDGRTWARWLTWEILTLGAGPFELPGARIVRVSDVQYAIQWNRA